MQVSLTHLSHFKIFLDNEPQINVYTDFGKIVNKTDFQTLK